MVTAYYFTAFALSLALTIAYRFIWHKHFDANITLIFTLVPLTNLGYLLWDRATTLDAALIAVRMTYIGGCYLPMLIATAVFNLCDIRLRRWQRMLMTLVSTVVFLSAMTIGKSPYFYRDAVMTPEDGTLVLQKHYGFMHTVFQAMVFLYFFMGLSAIIYTYCKKNQVSRKTLYLLFFPVLVSMVTFFGLRRALGRVELIAAAFVVAQITYLIISYRICLYDVVDTAADTLVQNGDTGLVSFDFKFHYLGSNETAKRLFPALNELTVDRGIRRSDWMRENALVWLEAFKADETQNTRQWEKDDRYYLITISYLYDGRRKRGYEFFIADNTQDQQYIHLLDSYNTQLQAEVARKTAHIVEMHDKLILGMATMVESRDNSTGGHIRRTSEGVRLLIEEMKRDAGYGLTEDFCRNIIKAAPMHDLGKIAVDDDILRKPGRFTPGEYDQMKRHAAEGARIVHEILEGTEDEDFRRIAENVAHYHHERWDGSGYPEGLRGEEIPLEARIMAVADVYDALVSKRVYKDSMPFDKADAIILSGMGTQFDPALQPFYAAARPKLEAYYSGIGRQ